VTSGTRGTQTTAPPWRGAHGVGISQTVLVACSAFDPRLPGDAVASAIARGLRDGGLPEPDICPLPSPDATTGPGTADGMGEDDVRDLLDAVGFDARMRAARAVVVGMPRLEESALAGSFTFEIATRARQSGVPTYAVTAESVLSPFDARILDLQFVLRAGSRGALAAAGRRLARLV
jgi:glycerate kinase